MIVTRPSRELPEGCALLSLPDDPESDEPPAEASFPLDVGYQNRGTAWRAVHDSLNSRIAEAVTEYRELELARLDALQAAHWPQAV